MSGRSLTTMLLPEVHGWRPAEPDGIYTADTLFDYIDGAAEVYRSFNVRRAVGRRYSRPGQPDILADVFDMGSPADAYGAYHHDIREGEDAGCGQDSEYLSGALSFWKDRYFVSIIPFDETPESEMAVRTLAAAIDQAIPQEGAPPDMVALLPEDGRLERSTRYFHNHHCLNAYYYLADDNLLALGPDTDGVLGQYEAPGGRFFLAIFRYPTAAGSQEALQSFSEVYLPDADVQGTARTENGAWAAAAVAGRHVVGVFEAPSRETAVNAIAGTRDMIENREDTRDD